MIRTLSLTLMAALVFCSQAKADFIIDSFSFADTVANDATATLVHAAGGGNIFVEASTTGGMTFFAADKLGYAVSAGAMGDSFTLSYTWDTPTFDDLQSVSGNELNAIPAAFTPPTGWDLTISTDGVTNAYAGSSLGAPGGPIALDAATELTFTYTWTLATIPAFGANGFFGGFGTPLVATPEPTAFAMLGSVAALGLVRRRRR